MCRGECAWSKVVLCEVDCIGCRFRRHQTTIIGRQMLTNGENRQQLRNMLGVEAAAATAAKKEAAAKEEAAKGAKGGVYNDLRMRMRMSFNKLILICILTHSHWPNENELF